MKEVYAVYWYDKMCPEDDGCYIGIGSTEAKAKAIGEKYLRLPSNPGGEYVIITIVFDKIRAF